MKIRVELVGQFRDILGFNETLVEVEKNSTLCDLIRRMAETHGEKFGRRVFVKDTGRVSEDVTLVLNGKVIPVEEASSVVLKENDTVILMPEAII